jgi:putative membrane protein
LAAVAVLLIALALSGIIRNLRRSDGREVDHAGHSGHTHQRGIGWMLIIPVVVLAFVVPPALGAQAAAPIAVTLSPDELRQPFPPLPTGRAPEVSMKEVIKRVALDSADTLYGRLITLIGFTLKRDNRIDLARISIFCCAADAQLGRVHLDGQNAAPAARLPDNTWLRVEGTLTKPAQSSGPPTVVILTMTVSTTTRVDPPANTYAY